MADPLPIDGAEGASDHSSAVAVVTVRYWGAARAAAGVETETVVGETLADVLSAVHANHPDRRFGDVVETCAVIVGDQPVGARDPASIRMSAGASIEFLPPFAGG